MDKIYIKVDRKTGMVYLDNTVIGRDNENLQQELIFSFENGFVLGSPRLEYKIVNNKYHIPMEIDGENYKTPVKNILTKEGRVEMQLVVVQIAQNEEIPIFKSNVFYMYCNKSINAQEEAPDDYEYWLDVLEEKIVEMDEALAEVDNLDIDANKVDTTTTIEITKKDGTSKTVQVLDGIDGVDGTNGQDATINGVNTLTIEAGDNITLEQTGSTLTINSTGGSGGTSNYQYLTNKPSINEVILTGNKSLSDLGIQPAGNYLTEETDPTVPSHVKNITQANITSWNNKSNFSGNYNDLTNKPTIPDVSNFITKDVNDLTYYELKTNTGSIIELSINSSTYVVTLNLKNSAGTVISTGNIDLPLESVVVNGSYNNTTKKVILTLQSGSTIEFSVADLVAGLQSEITSTNKLNSDLVDDENSTNKFVSSQEKTTWNNKSDFSGSYNDLTNKPTIPSALSDLSDDSTHRVVSDTEKTTWNNKGTYSKPTNGIPKTDLASDVQTSLGKADTALQTHQDISGKLDTSKVKNVNSITAGDVYDVRYINSQLGDISTILASVVTVGGGE